MKITDYGLWYRVSESEVFVKRPRNIGVFYVYLNGNFLGELCFTEEVYFYVSLAALRRIGFVISERTPGTEKNGWWFFPATYLPTDSDFQELL